MTSFITLNSHDKKVRSTEFNSRDIGEDDPFSGSRRIGFDDGRTRSGVVSFSGDKKIERFPHWELVIVTRGSPVLSIDGMQIAVPAGNAFIVNRGARVSIAADSTVEFVFLVVAEKSAANPEPATVVLLDRQANLFPSPSVDADILIGQAPTCRNHRMLVRDDIAVRAGLWDSTPYEREFVQQKEHELMHITKGSVVFSDSVGRNEVYTEGETFLVPKGVQGKWTSTVHVAKIYAVVT